MLQIRCKHSLRIDRDHQEFTWASRRAVLESQFPRISKNGATRHSKAPQRKPKDGGAPKAFQLSGRIPNGAEINNKDAKRSPMASQRDPNPWHPMREFKGRLYTQKLPISRTAGRYVIRCAEQWWSPRAYLPPLGEGVGYKW